MQMELSERCEKHDRIKESVKMPFSNNYRYHCPDCGKDEEASRIKFDEAERLREYQSAINSRVENSMIAPRFRTKTLDTYDATLPGQKKALEAARVFVETTPNSPGMLFIGGPGTGKNHLAAGIALELLQRGKTVIFTELLKAVRTIKESWKKEEDCESKILKAFLLPDLLILDEIGVQFQSETERLYLTEIVNDRYNYLKPTILIGNLSVSELKIVIGERVLDRLREGGKIVMFDWESYRKLNHG